MSHVVSIETELSNLAAIRAACEALGLTFKEDQKTYDWWGQHVGDYPLPEGFTPADLGHCEHAIGVPGTSWEIGVVKAKNRPGYTLLFDFYGAQGKPILKALGGQKAEKFLQQYGIHNTRLHVEQKLKGQMIIMAPTANNVVRAKLVFSV